MREVRELLRTPQGKFVFAVASFIAINFENAWRAVTEDYGAVPKRDPIAFVDSSKTVSVDTLAISGDGAAGDDPESGDSEQNKSSEQKVGNTALDHQEAGSDQQNDNNEDEQIVETPADIVHRLAEGGNLTWHNLVLEEVLSNPNVEVDSDQVKVTAQLMDGGEYEIIFSKGAGGQLAVHSVGPRGSDLDVFFRLPQMVAGGNETSGSASSAGAWEGAGLGILNECEGGGVNQAWEQIMQWGGTRPNV